MSFILIIVGTRICRRSEPRTVHQKILLYVNLQFFKSMQLKNKHHGELDEPECGKPALNTSFSV